MGKKSRPRAAREFFWATHFPIEFGRICSKIYAVFSYEHISNQSTHPGAVFRAHAAALSAALALAAVSAAALSAAALSAAAISAATYLAAACVASAAASRRPQLLAQLGSARLARLGSRLGSALGSARHGSPGLDRHGSHSSARLSTAQHGSARAGTAAAARTPSWSALLRTAQLSSAQLLSREVRADRLARLARSARLARLRLTRFLARRCSTSPPPAVRSTGKARRSRALAKIGLWAGRVRHCHAGTKGAGQGRAAYPTNSTVAERSQGVLRGENGRDW